MSKSKKVVISFLALSMCAAMSMPAFAAEPNVDVSVNQNGETVYTQTIDMQDIMAYSTTADRTVSADKTLSLALDPGKSGQTLPVQFRFSTLPESAEVQSIEILPGRATINNNNLHMTGAVVFTSMTLMSPDGKQATFTWNPQSIKDKVYFSGKKAKGTWTLTVKGTNLARPTGDPIQDLLSVGSLAYKSAKMTISYVVK